MTTLMNDDKFYDKQEKIKKYATKTVITIAIAFQFVIIGFSIYQSLTRDEHFEAAIKEQKITLTEVEPAIQLSGRGAIFQDCPYQISFNGVNSSNEMVKGKYCETIFSYHVETKKLLMPVIPVVAKVEPVVEPPVNLQNFIFDKTE